MSEVDDVLEDERRQAVHGSPHGESKCGVAKRCADLAFPLFKAAGGSGIFDTQPFGRFYTDILAMGNHAANQFQIAGRNWGAVMMGMDSQDQLL